MRAAQNAAGHPTPRGGEVSFRMLVQQAAAGSIIGRGGEVIQAIRHETESRVKMHPETPGTSPCLGLPSPSARLAMSLTLST